MSDSQRLTEPAPPAPLQRPQQLSQPLTAEDAMWVEGNATGRRGRLLCWVLTMPASHSTKATAVNKTWGPM